MFAPTYAPNFERRINSSYLSPSSVLTAGQYVEIDSADTGAIPSSVGFSTLKAGTVKAFTSPVVPAVAAQQTYYKGLGFAIASVNATGPVIIEKILELASSYMTIPEGLNLAVYSPQPHDIIATDQYVTSGTGLLDTTNTANFLVPVEVFGGQFRIAQTGNTIIGRYVGNTTVNGVQCGLFEIL